MTLACTREESRPAKEAVAEAKGTAAEAEKAAHQAAQQAKESAAAAAAEAHRTVTSPRVAVQQGVARAEEKTRSGVDAVATGVRELGEGGAVTERVRTVSRSHLALRPEGRGPTELRVDKHTRFHAARRGPRDAAPRRHAGACHLRRRGTRPRWPPRWKSSPHSASPKGFPSARGLR